MKNILLLLIILLLASTNLVYGQTKNPQARATLSASQNTPVEQNTGFTETVTIPVTTGTSTSGNSRAPQGSQRYIRTCYIITAAEMQAAGFPLGNINLIGFTYVTAQSVATTGTFKVYLKNTTDVIYSLPSTSWTNGSNGVIDGMTLACDRTITIPNTTGVFDIPFTGGSTFTYTGGGIYVAFEYQNPSPGTISTANVAYCNTTITTGLRNAFSTTTLPTTLANSSAFRPITRLGADLIDVAEVTQIYALGQIPVPFGNPNVIKTIVTNKSDAALTFDVNINVFKASDGTSRYSNTQTVTDLAAGASQTVTFSDYTSSIIETDSIKVTVAAQPGETWTINNTRSVVQDVNNNTYSYNQGSVATGGVGFTGATGDFVAKFTTNSPNSINQIDWNFSTGGQPFQIGIWDATGAGGTPGTNLWTSASGTSVAGVSTILVSPPVSVNGDFYVGVRQTGTVNVSFSYQAESPIRPSTFYYTSPTGGTTWNDFAPANPYRFMIAPKFALNNDVGVTAINQYGTSYITDGATAIPMTGTVANYGQISASFDVTRTIKDNTNTVVYSNTQSVSNLASNGAANVTFTDFTGFTSGATYSITDSTILSGDQNTTNNALTRTYIPTYSKDNLVLYTDAASRDSLVAHLAGAGMSAAYNLVDGTTFSGTFRNWKSVYYVLASSGNWTAAVRDSLKAFLDNSTTEDKKSLYIFGNDLGYANDPLRNVSATAADTVFYRQYLHAQYIMDDWNALNTSKLVQGIAGYSAIASDSVNDSFPDLVKPVNGGKGVIILATESGDGDSCIAVAYSGTYNSFYGSNLYASYRAATLGSTQTLFNTIRNGGGQSVAVSFIPEGYHNTENNTLNLRDTFKVYLANTNSPYSFVDSANVVIDSLTFSGNAVFNNAANGTYYLVVGGRNLVQTWSMAGGMAVAKPNSYTYNFTSDSLQSLGANAIKHGSLWCIYSGDVNQDGFVDFSDLTLIDNDAYNFTSGYSVTDLNGDLFVDFTDLTLCDNNAYNFVGSITPSASKRQVSIRVQN